MEDEISTVTNSISKLGYQMIEMREDMNALSGSLRTELAEMKQILLGMHFLKQMWNCINFYLGTIPNLCYKNRSDL
jgi:hypothetical protein